MRLRRHYCAVRCRRAGPDRLWSSAAVETPARPGSEWTGFPRTVEHAMGKTEIPTKPKRVVALDTSFVDATLILDTPVVGYTDYRTHQREAARLPGRRPDDVRQVRRRAVGTLAEPNLEKIAALEPGSDRHREGPAREALRAAERRSRRPSCRRPPGRPGRTTSGSRRRRSATEALAEEEISSYETAAKSVGAAINAKAKNPTISVVRFVDGPTRLYQKASFSGIVLKDAGLARPKSQDVDGFALEISPERIKDADARRDLRRHLRRREGCQQEDRRPVQGQPAVEAAGAEGARGPGHHLDDGGRSAGRLGDPHRPGQDLRRGWHRSKPDSVGSGHDVGAVACRAVDDLGTERGCVATNRDPGAPRTS